MATTLRRRSFCCTKESEEQLESLKYKLGESTSQIVKRAINMMYRMEKRFEEGDKTDSIVFY